MSGGSSQPRLVVEGLGRDASEAVAAYEAAVPIWRLLRRRTAAPFPAPVDRVADDGGDDDDDDDDDLHDEVEIDEEPVELRRSSALSDVSFEVRSGEAVAVVGGPETGARTLVQIVSGLFPPDRGRAVVYGRRSLASSHNKGLLRDWPLNAQTGALATVAYVPRRDRKRWRADLVRTALYDDEGKMLTDFELATKRLAIVASFDPTADLLLIDALPPDDPLLRARCERRLEQALERGAGALVWITRAPSLARYCERAIRFDEGVIAEVGSPETLVARERGRVERGARLAGAVRGFNADAAILAIREASDRNGAAEIVVELETALPGVQLEPRIVLRRREDGAAIVARGAVYVCDDARRYALRCSLTPPAGVSSFAVDVLLDVESIRGRATVGRLDVGSLPGAGDDFQLDATDAALGDAEDEILEASWRLEPLADGS